MEDMEGVISRGGDRSKNRVRNAIEDPEELESAKKRSYLESTVKKGATSSNGISLQDLDFQGYS